MNDHRAHVLATRVIRVIRRPSFRHLRHAPGNRPLKTGDANRDTAPSTRIGLSTATVTSGYEARTVNLGRRAAATPDLLAIGQDPSRVSPGEGTHPLAGRQARPRPRPKGRRR